MHVFNVISAQLISRLRQPFSKISPFTDSPPSSTAAFERPVRNALAADHKSSETAPFGPSSQKT
ncbi:hypothetical protein BDW72DRAFT_41059 [Aspergillus terricola var. indicus]